MQHRRQRVSEDQEGDEELQGQRHEHDRQRGHEAAERTHAKIDQDAGQYHGHRHSRSGLERRGDQSQDQLAGRSRIEARPKRKQDVARRDRTQDEMVQIRREQDG